MAFDFDAFSAECPSAIAVVADDGTIVFANRSLAALVGYGLAELSSAGVSALVPERLAPLPGTGWIQHVVQNAGHERRLLWPLCHRSKTEMESQWWVLVGHDAGGRELMQIVFAQRRTITAQAAPTEADVATPHEQVYRIMFDNVPTGIFHFDARGVITECNDRFVRVIGSSRRHLIGIAMLTLPSAAMVDVAKRALRGEAATYVGPYTSATGGKTSWVRVVMAPTFDEAGQVTGGVGLVEDQTEQRRAAEIVSKTERLASLGTLAAGVVHEVQNPLAYVIANLDLALRAIEHGAGKRDDVKAALVAARDGASRVASIARDLKTFAKSDEAPRGPVDVCAALETALKLTQNTVRTRARLERDFEPVGMAWASEARLVQVFVNLLVNAAEAISPGESADPSEPSEASVVTVRTHMHRGKIRVDVEDTGDGVSAEDAAKIFEPFWTSKTSGMGLGLAICHGIVSSLGGEIFLDMEEKPKRGSRFTVVLPPAGDRETPSLAPPPSTRTKAAVRAASQEPIRGRVLIVDDEQRLAETLRISLSATHDVEIATRGRRALELLLGPNGQGDFDVILCDILMPELTGVELYDAVHAARPDLSPRFVFLTGGAFSKSIQEFLQRVPNPRIEKPFDLDVLERTVDERIAIARAK